MEKAKQKLASFWEKTKEYSKKGAQKAKHYSKVGAEKAKEGYEKSKKAVKDKIHEEKRKLALSVLKETKGKVTTNQEKIVLKGAQQIVSKKFDTGGGVGKDRYNLSFNYNPSVFANEDAEMLVNKYTKDWNHDNDWDEVSFYANGLLKEKAIDLKKELQMEDVYNIEIEKSRYSYKTGGVIPEELFEKDYLKFKKHIKDGYGKIDSGYIEETWENLSDLTYSMIEDKLVKRLKKDGLYNYGKGGKMSTGGEVSDTKYQKLKSLIENRKYNEAVDYYLNNANITSNFVGSDVWNKLKKENNFKEFEKIYNNDDRVGMHHDSYATGGGVNDSGLMVIGKTTLDNNSIGDVVEEEGYYAEWNPREGYWFFPEEVDMYDDLEMELDKHFVKRGINARFEGVFSKGGSIKSFKAGDKVKTREGKIETIIRKNKNGNYETKECDYTWNPADLTLVSRANKPYLGEQKVMKAKLGAKMATGGTVIGKTNSGKSVYSGSKASIEKNYTAQDHKDAAYINLDKATELTKKGLRESAEFYNSEFDRHIKTSKHKGASEMATGGSCSYEEGGNIKGWSYEIGGL